MEIILDILRYLEEHRISLADVCRATGVATQNIRKSLENNPKTSTVLSIANGLNIDPREFYYMIDDNGMVTSMPPMNNIRNIENVLENEGKSQDPTPVYCPKCGTKFIVLASD